MSDWVQVPPARLVYRCLAHVNTPARPACPPIPPLSADKTRARLRFIKSPEYLRQGMRLVFREGRTKAVGTIVTVCFGPPFACLYAYLSVCPLVCLSACMHAKVSISVCYVTLAYEIETKLIGLNCVAGTPR